VAVHPESDGFLSKQIPALVRLEANGTHGPAHRLAIDLDDGLTAQARARAIDHLDAPEEALLATQIDWHLPAGPHRPVDLQNLLIAVHVDEPDREEVQVIALRGEMQGAEGAVAEPVLGLAD